MFIELIRNQGSFPAHPLLEIRRINLDEARKLRIEKIQEATRQAAQINNEMLRTGNQHLLSDSFRLAHTIGLLNRNPVNAYWEMILFGKISVRLNTATDYLSLSEMDLRACSPNPNKRVKAQLPAKELV